MSSSNSVLRRYTPPTCTLEITASGSPLSRWMSRPALKQLKFQLSLDDPRLPEEKRLTLRGDKTQLETLREVVEVYVQKFVVQSPNPSNNFGGISTTDQTSLEESDAELDPHQIQQPQPSSSLDKFVAPADTPIAGATNGNNQVYEGAIAIQPNGLLAHNLFLGSLATPESGSTIPLTTLQLFDLATALEQYAEDVVALPSLNPAPAKGFANLVKAPPMWAKVAALLVVSVGATATAMKLLNKNTTTQQAAAPAPSPEATPIAPPPIAAAPSPIPTLGVPSPPLSSSQTLPTPLVGAGVSPTPGVLPTPPLGAGLSPTPGSLTSPLGSGISPTPGGLTSPLGAGTSPNPGSSPSRTWVMPTPNPAPFGSTRSATPGSSQFGNRFPTSDGLAFETRRPNPAASPRPTQPPAQRSFSPTPTPPQRPSPNQAASSPTPTPERVAKSKPATTPNRTVAPPRPTTPSAPEPAFFPRPGQNPNIATLPNQPPPAIPAPPQTPPPAIQPPPFIVMPSPTASAVDPSVAALRAIPDPKLENSPPAQDQSRNNDPADPIPQVTEVRRYFQGRWKPPANLTQDIEYTLSINPDGSLNRVTPRGQTAEIFLDRTQMPVGGEAFVSPIEGGANATIILILSKDGSVRTFLVQQPN